MSGIKQIAAKLAAFFQKHRCSITGAGVYYGANWVFNNPIWMYSELKWGMSGIIGMVIAALVTDTILLFYFRNKRTDFILLNAFDDLSISSSKFNEVYDQWKQKKTIWKSCFLVVSYVPVRLTIFALWFLRRFTRLTDLVALIVISILDNAFTATMYLRHGNYNRLRARDYAVYLISSVITLGYWALRNAAIVELVFRPLLN